MNSETSVQNAVDQLLPDPGRVVGERSVGGGCISNALCIELRDESGEPRRLFAKRNRADFEDNFRCEWTGLKRLADAEMIAVPTPVAVGCADGASWLFLEWIEQASRRDDYYAAFGAQLARLHRATRGSRIGLDRDNYLGSARQPNSPTESWVEFVADRRLGFQLRWATDQGLADTSLRNHVSEVIDRLPGLLSGRVDETSLLHGDLWSGNYVADADGGPVILDPAIYYGCREAEFGMLRLFGSCPREFYDAYQQEWPLEDGWHQRVNVYVLYHLLNHLNLFGSGYAPQCRSTAAEILRG